jgi:hypothetical protein
MLNYKEFLNEQKLFEIGEGVRPFPWKRVGVTKVESWMSDLAMVNRAESVQGKWEQLPTLLYEFTGDKATYGVSIAGGWSKHVSINFGRKPGAPKPHDYNLIIVVAFDIKDKVNPNDEPEITNFGEQFKVLSTVVDIAETVVKQISEIKWIKLEEIRIAPKLEDGEEGKPITQSKRGRFYLEYIKKQGRKLPGEWTAEVTSDMFVLRNGKWSSKDSNRFIAI